MLSEARMKTSEEDSAEGLLNFLNTASSSVKSVLARPSCFKRNTNHRRFIQKQLKVSKQRHELPVSSVKLIPKQQIKLSKARQRVASRRRTDLNKREVNSMNINAVNIQRSNDFKSNGQNSISNARSRNDFEQEMKYFAECKKFSEMVDDLVDNLLDSSSTSSQDETYQDIGISDVPPHSYYRSGSVSSYSSSSEEELNPEFLSGEELLRCLDISELFIPDELSAALQQGVAQKEVEKAELQIVPGDESPAPEHLMYEADMAETQSMPVFENVFQQFSL